MKRKPGTTNVAKSQQRKSSICYFISYCGIMGGFHTKKKSERQTEAWVGVRRGEQESRNKTRENESVFHMRARTICSPSSILFLRREGWTEGSREEEGGWGMEDQGILTHREKCSLTDIFIADYNDYIAVLYVHPPRPPPCAEFMTLLHTLVKRGSRSRSGPWTVSKWTFQEHVGVKTTPDVLSNG